MLHSGVLAHSADGAALSFLEMVRESARRLGAHEHPEITLSALPMGPTLAAYARGDLAPIGAHLARTAARLADTGCDFFVCPDNTAHIALDAWSEPRALPGLHICDTVARQACADGRRRVGLLGTRWTMEGPGYRAAFARAGLEIHVPPEPDRALVDHVIFSELCEGVLRHESRASFVRIIAELARAGARCGRGGAGGPTAADMAGWRAARTRVTTRDSKSGLHVPGPPDRHGATVQPQSR